MEHAISYSNTSAFTTGRQSRNASHAQQRMLQGDTVLARKMHRTTTPPEIRVAVVCVRGHLLQWLHRPTTARSPLRFSFFQGSLAARPFSPYLQGPHPLPRCWTRKNWLASSRGRSPTTDTGTCRLHCLLLHPADQDTETRSISELDCISLESVAKRSSSQECNTRSHGRSNWHQMRQEHLHVRKSFLIEFCDRV